MAWHGGTHLSLGENTARRSIELELQLAQTLAPVAGFKPTSVIYPRNCVGHQALLQAHGFTSYRKAPWQKQGGALWRRVCQLGKEFNVLAQASCQFPAKEHAMVAHPGGDFLNWPRGARALATPAMTIARWKSLLKSARVGGRYLHMWFHPHNLITAPEMAFTFEAIMELVAQEVKNGCIENRVMADQIFLEQLSCPT